MLMIDGKLPGPTRRQPLVTKPKLQTTKRATTQAPDTTTKGQAGQPDAVAQKIDGDCKNESESKYGVVT